MAKQTGTKKVITVTAKAKKPASGKTTPKTTAAKKTSSQETAKGPKGELIGLLENLEAEEISWLITQVKTMMYNKKVVELNKAAVDLANSKKGTATTSGGQAPAKAPDVVDIVQAGSPKNFNIVMGNAHLFLNLGELKDMVRIAQTAGNPDDGAARLYAWCRKERTDMINDAGLSGPKDPRLNRLCILLRERYSVE